MLVSLHVFLFVRVRFSLANVSIIRCLSQECALWDIPRRVCSIPKGAINFNPSHHMVQPSSSDGGYNSPACQAEIKLHRVVRVVV